MTTPRIYVHHIENDFAVNDLDNLLFERADIVTISSYWNGQPAPEGRHTEVLCLWSDSSLYFRFHAYQSEPLIVNSEPQTAAKTLRLWERDVCEVFLAPDASEPRRYAEFEIAPTGEWLDLIVDWTKDEPRDWGYASGLEAYARIGEDNVTMMLKVPWTAFDRKPKPGDVWIGNLFRQVGSGEARGYLAWSPTMTEEPNFHVPDAFGEFIFVD